MPPTVKLMRFVAPMRSPSEYVVLATEGEPKDHAKPGYTHKETVDIVGDAAEEIMRHIPCDVPLSADD